MAVDYDREKYRELKRQGLPWRIALSLSRYDSPVDDELIDGGDAAGSNT